MLELDLHNMENSQIKLLRSRKEGEGVQKLPVMDRFYFNQYFPIPENILQDEEFQKLYIPDSETRDSLMQAKSHQEFVGIVGRCAFHIFDKTNRQWVCSTKALAYEKLYKH